MAALNEGVALFNRGLFAEALAVFDAALASGGGDPELRVLRAHVLDSLERPDEAVAAFAALIREAPRHLAAYDGLTAVMTRRGPRAGAASALGALLALRPGDASFRRRLIDSLRRAAKAFRAVDDAATEESFLRRARALGPRDPETRGRLVEILRRRAQSSLAAGDLTAAAAALREVLTFVPGDGAARRELIKVLLSSGETAAAERELRRSLARDSRDRGALLSLLEVLHLRAEVYLAAGESLKAERSLRQAAALAPRESEPKRRLIRLLRARGQEFQSASRRRDAEAVARRILALDPRDPWAHLSRGSVAFTSGRVREGRALLAAAVRFDREDLTPADRFKALMKLGRYRDAVSAAEAILDAKPALSDLRVFWDPWEWDDRRPRSERVAELRKLERALGAGAPTPWLHYYRADLRGPEGLEEFARISAFPPERYGWMYFKAASAALLAGRYARAAEWFELCLRQEPVDWRAHAFLAESCLCLGRIAPAYAAMDRALAAAPAGEAGQVLAWRGAFDLWLGRYDDALIRFEEACRQGAQCGFCWKGAALLLLGRPKEALAQLDLTLRRYPLDFEALVWRGETKRVLGRNAAALRDLENKALVDPKKSPPIWLWALFNRALVKRALGDRPGMRKDFALIPKPVVAYIRRKSGAAEPEDILAEGLRLARGFRRDEYGQAIWMTEPG